MIKKIKKILNVGYFIMLLSFNNLQANNIKDFQIEGISLYDSALDYFSKKEIENNKVDWYKNKKFSTISIFNHPSFKKYEELQISYKTNDKNYIIVDLSGIVGKDFNECMTELVKVENDLSSMFKGTKKRKQEKYSHPVDPSNNSKIVDVYWKFNNGDLVLAACYDWSQEGKFANYKDDFRVTISNKEFDMFLSSNPY